MLRVDMVDDIADDSDIDNGVITATDYLAERNAEHQARLTQALHRLQLIQAQVQYLTILGETP